MNKKIIALLLTLALCMSLLAACASDKTEKTPEEPAQSETPETPEAPEAPEEPEAPETPEEPDEPDEPEEITTISFWYYDLYGHGENGQKVEDAINAITEPEAGVHVDITWADVGTFMSQVPVSIAGGEQIDLICLTPMPVVSVGTMHANGQLVELTELLQTYAPDAYSMMQDYLGAYSYNDGLYGLPTNKNWATNNYIIMRKNILEEMGMLEFAQNMTKWSEYEQLMQAVLDTYGGELAPISNSTSNVVMRHNGYWNTVSDEFADYVAFDSLGDSLNVLASDNEGHVLNFYEDPRTEADLARVADWAQKGYLYGDAAFTDEFGDSLIMNNVSFSDLDGGEIGIETRKLTACGQEMVCVKTSSGYIKTSSLTSWGIGIPCTSEEPEAAAKFINVLYTNKDVLNLLVFGLEGENWAMTDTGEIDYPAGVDSATVGYRNADWLVGDQFLLLPWVGAGVDYRALAQQENVNCDVSPYLGFTLNTTGMDTLLANLTAVLSEYEASIKCGLYTEDLYDEFLASLKTAGIDDYVAEAQSQLDAWRAAQ